MTKNIWIINHYANMGKGRHYNFALNLVKKGYRVTIICASTSIKNKDIKFKKKQKVVTKSYQGIDYIIVKARDYIGNGKARFQNMFDFSFRAYNYLKKKDIVKPDVIYASSVHPLTWLVGHLMSKRYKANSIIETRDLWPETLIRMGRIKSKSIPARLLYSLEKHIYKQADQLIFTMPGGKKYLEERKYKYKKVTYINNGVDLKSFDQNLQKFPNSYFDESDGFNVVYTGSMGIANAIPTIIDAAKYLQDKEYDNIKFHLFGGGYLESELRDYAEQLELKNIVFYGKVNKVNIPGILKASDLNIATSQNINLYDYGVSLNKYFDYFASGKPVITNIPSPYNKIEKYECGIRVDPDDPKKLALGIIEISELESEVYDRKCINARETAEKFDYKVLTNKLDSIIKSFDIRAE